MPGLVCLVFIGRTKRFHIHIKPDMQVNFRFEKADREEIVVKSFLDACQEGCEPAITLIEPLEPTLNFKQK